MRRKRFFRSWLLAPPLSGKLAIACSLTAVAVPTLIRLAFDGMVMGVDCVAYTPFVLIAAVLMSWRYAAFVAVSSMLVCDYLFMGLPDRLFESETDWFAMSIFLAYCLLVIGLAQGIRKMVATFPRRADPEEDSSGIIFSLENGQAWASWSGGDAPVPLGPCDEVAEMMEDFLAQVELGKRLTAKIAVHR
jgi:hypothetical protein